MEEIFINIENKSATELMKAGWVNITATEYQKEGYVVSCSIDQDNNKFNLLYKPYFHFFLSLCRSRSGNLVYTAETSIGKFSCENLELPLLEQLNKLMYHLSNLKFHFVEWEDIDHEAGFILI